jgi:spore coat protein U-like protein
VIRLATCLALLVAAAVLPAQAQAQARGHIERCDILLNPVVFGNFKGERIDVRGGVRLTCEGSGNNNPLAVALSQGVSNSFITRRMVNVLELGSNARLEYNLYIDAVRTTIWGDGAGETRRQLAQLDFQGGRPTQVEFDIFARLERQPLPVPGLYVDQIVVTVTF